MERFIGNYAEWEPAITPKGTQNMESTAIKQVQKPELYMAVDLEMMAKGGWKRTLKASVRVFDGNELDAEVLMKELLNAAGKAAQAQIDIEDAAKETTTNEHV